MFIFNPLMVCRQAIIQALKSWKQEQILSGSYAVDINDNFGLSVAINSTGNKIIVGASADKAGSYIDRGIAYIFTSSSAGWIQESILNGSLATGGDRFGYSVAINSSGSIAIVGAPYDEIGSTTSTGIAYIFVSSSGGWAQQQTLYGSLATHRDDNFGYSVAINSTGNIIVVGAPYDETGSYQANNGLAYVFVNTTGVWTQQKILSGSLASDGDSFGTSVAINSIGDKIVVGAERDGKIAGGAYPGLAYVFTSSSSGWAEEKILSGSFANESQDAFGCSVNINSAGDKIVVGAYYDEKQTSPDTGLVYIFVSSSNGWTEQKVLSGSLVAGAQDEYFGYSVSINSVGDKIVVGAMFDETGSNYNQGLAYIFVSSSTDWIQQNIISGSLATDTNDYFGCCVSINSVGDKIVIGASSDEKQGLNNTGLTYVFTES